ncbi:MAG: M28 family peptidase [Pseudomonadota bacterium]
MNTHELCLSNTYTDHVVSYLKRLTCDIHDRSTGSEGNREAAALVAGLFRSRAWTTQTQDFQALDWQDNKTTLTATDGAVFDVSASPYSAGCEALGNLTAVSTLEELEAADLSKKLVLLHGEIVQEPLMPKNFPFYSVDEHQRIIARLEQSGAIGVICAMPHNEGASTSAALPPLIEDGDFDIPSVFMTEAEGHRLLPYDGKRLVLISRSQRVSSTASNVIAQINGNASKRIVVTAHIDAKKGTPGALDNGTGITTLLLLSELLADYTGDFCIELVALNGEDHYAVPGQVAYLAANSDMFGSFKNVALNINIDGVGYVEGETAFSFFGLPADMNELAIAELLNQPGSCRGIEWPQGDHSMFVQAGCPAIAVTSNWLLENMATQLLTHSADDKIERVDPLKVVACAQSLKSFIEALS